MEQHPSQVVADFYDASLDPTRWPQALLALGELANADMVALAVHDFESGSGHLERAIGIPADAQSSYRRLHSRSSVWLQAESHFRAAPSVVRGSDIISEDAVRTSPFHRNWLRPARLFNHLFAILEREGDSMIFFVLARRDGKQDFSDETIEQVAALLPALGRAYRAGEGVRQLRALEYAALRAIDTMPIGVAVLDRSGAVIEANARAKAALDAGSGLITANGGLAIDAGGRRVKLRELMVSTSERGGASGEEVAALSVPRTSGQRPLTVMLLPLDPTTESAEGPAALLFIGDPERSMRFDQSRIARLYGLSRAESRVAALLASGYRLEQVAEMLGIAYETVRKHLKQIFGKTGTYRQAELVRMLVTGPAGLSI